MSDLCYYTVYAKLSNTFIDNKQKLQTRQQEKETGITGAQYTVIAISNLVPLHPK